MPHPWTALRNRAESLSPLSPTKYWVCYSLGSMAEWLADDLCPQVCLTAPPRTSLSSLQHWYMLLSLLLPHVLPSCTHHPPWTSLSSMRDWFMLLSPLSYALPSWLPHHPQTSLSSMQDQSMTSASSHALNRDACISRGLQESVARSDLSYSEEKIARGS